MLEPEKVKHLFSHWLEHSREHTAKYEEWAEKLEKEKPEVAKLLREAVEKFREGEKLLEEALKMV